MPFEVQVIERTPVPSGQRFWDVVGSLMPMALAPTATRMQLRAPKGKTGKLSRRVQVRSVRVNQGFVQGVEAQFIVAVPYGHLVSLGHRIIPRGPGRGGKVTKMRRTELRTALRSRRAMGATGFVPGNPFATGTLTEDRPLIVQRLEQGLAAGRVV